MKRLILTVSNFFLLAFVLGLTVERAQAQDPVTVDSKHYSVVFENDQVRVLRIKYGPHEKSVMHYHPDAVAVFLKDAMVKMNLPDGTTADAGGKAGTTIWTPAGKHLPENVGKKPFEVILVELKGKSGNEK